MIVTVTMNPAIDKTIEISTLVTGGLNRILSTEADAGGKGINVSKTINSVGGQTIATGFLGGEAGKSIENTLTNMGIKSDFIYVDGETRTNTKVHEQNGPITELNELGVNITEESLNLLIEKIVSYANEETIFVLAGSVPTGVPKDIYKQIALKVKPLGSTIIVDADGELFVNSLLAKPNVIKPNREELAEYAGISGTPTETQLIDIASKMINDGIELVVISMGSDGALFISKDEKVKCNGLKVQASSTVGAGDAMVSGLAYSLNAKSSFEEMVKLSVALSAGAVTTVGTKPPSKELTEKLKNDVILNKIGE